MKMKKRTLIYQITIIGILLMLVGSCKKNDEYPSYQTNGKTSAVFNPNLTYGSLTDQEGNIYKTITIGYQTWMAENLRTTKYKNGENITLVKENDAWINLTEGAYCNYNNTKNLDTIASCGRLYNWFALSDNRNIAPKGWRVPTATDWITLITYLGDGDFATGLGTAGGKMKEIGIFHWISPNSDADNSTGFTALPGGYRSFNNGEFRLIGSNGYWWSTTENETIFAFIYQLFYYNKEIYRNIYSKNNGLSVRLIKD
jgi:uncharacterized protein (TIGR02145 family)